jgi:hypothetical protein
LVALIAQHQQESEVTAAEKHERAATETAATAARLMMAELAAVRAVAVADAAHAAAAELEALRGNSTSNSVSTHGGTNDKLKLAREAAREQAA